MQNPACGKEEPLVMRQAWYWVPRELLCRKGPGVCGGQWAEEEPTVCPSSMAGCYNLGFINRITTSRSKGVILPFTWHLLSYVWTTAHSFGLPSTGKTSVNWSKFSGGTPVQSGLEHLCSEERLWYQGWFSLETRWLQGHATAVLGTCSGVMEKMELDCSQWCVVGGSEISTSWKKRGFKWINKLNRRLDKRNAFFNGYIIVIGSLLY